MANYDDLKKKAKDALETIADVSAEAYKIAEEKAKILAKRAKLNAEITREKASIRRLKGEIGNKYYELHADSPEEALKEGCENITEALAQIEAKKRELEELKTGGVATECDCDDDCCEEATEETSEAAPEAPGENSYGENP